MFSSSAKLILKNMFGSSMAERANFTLSKEGYATYSHPAFISENFMNWQRAFEYPYKVTLGRKGLVKLLLYGKDRNCRFGPERVVHTIIF